MAKHHKGGRKETTGWIQRMLNQRSPDTTVKRGKISSPDLVGNSLIENLYEATFLSGNRNNLLRDGAREELKRQRWLERLG